MQSLFTSYLKKEYDGKSAAFELKIAKSNTLPFSRIEPHQIDALWRAKNERVVHKISDMSVGFKPWDCFILRNSDAFLVVMYYKPRTKKIVYFIDIDVLLTEIKKGGTSLSEEQAKLIASKVINL